MTRLATGSPVKIGEIGKFRIPRRLDLKVKDKYILVCAKIVVSLLKFEKYISWLKSGISFPE